MIKDEERDKTLAGIIACIGMILIFGVLPAVGVYYPNPEVRECISILIHPIGMIAVITAYLFGIAPLLFIIIGIPIKVIKTKKARIK